MSETVTAPQPLERRVTRYVCPFCHKGKSRREAIRAHMPSCYRNPAAKRCGTCANLQPAEPPEYGEYGLETYPGCPDGCDAGVEWPEGCKPVGCPQWAPATP